MLIGPIEARYLDRSPSDNTNQWAFDSRIEPYQSLR
jgi:hypothetical protein